ncbi:hypothetical protein CIK65_17340 [Brevibacterium aurantiacum]|uniref:Uncharacterized protein n=2 Tax=Brevibacterium aurantiacum TaxID=273384 RepID=A0A2A3YQD0_BREAU|nr:hypothetical protein CIK65_17340 [Brevibacterium aurantiacum]
MLYDGGMTDENCTTTTVRMFPDYADTVLWIVFPIDYEDTDLSPDLVSQLDAWEQSYYEALDADFNWKSADAARAFTQTGIDLAGQVANELGEEFVVEFASYEHHAPTYTVQSRSPADNDEAFAAFSTIVAELDAEDERAAQLVAEAGPDGEWTAYAPLSGETFTPGKHVPRTEDVD